MLVGASVLAGYGWLRRLAPASVCSYGPHVTAIERARAGREGVVLLTGSSYFEFWHTSAADLAPLDTVNVGIGGTRIGAQQRYFERLVVPFRPRALVIYAGSNDISGVPMFTRSASWTVPRVQEYIRNARRRLGGIPVFYVAITESPARVRVRDEIQQANRMLRNWAHESGEATFIDTAPVLLTPDGQIDGSLFDDDRLHLNERGYQRFARAIRTALFDAGLSAEQS